MPLDPELKKEVVSLLYGERFHPYHKKKSGRAASSLSVNDFHFHNLTGKRGALGNETFIDQEDFFDPDYDFDFTDLPGTRSPCTRGDEHYERPKGWYRIALKVKGKYQGGDAWLGNKRWRKRSERGEWPVSYHGTSLQGAKGIIRSHYNAGEGDRYGRGIYSTPDISVAEREEYAETFTSKTTGRRYKVILQNRINPENREVCPQSDYWLVNVPEGTSAEEERDIVENSIRPYGILIKEVNDDDGHDEDDEDGNEDGDYTGSDDNDADDYYEEADDDPDQEYEDDDGEDSRYDEEDDTDNCEDDDDDDVDTDDVDESDTVNGDDDVDNDSDDGDESDTENGDDDAEEDYDEGCDKDNSSGDGDHDDIDDGDGDGDDDEDEDGYGCSNDEAASDDEQYNDGDDYENGWDDDDDDDGDGCNSDGDDNDWY